MCVAHHSVIFNRAQQCDQCWLPVCSSTTCLPVTSSTVSACGARCSPLFINCDDLSRATRDSMVTCHHYWTCFSLWLVTFYNCPPNLKMRRASADLFCFLCCSWCVRVATSSLPLSTIAKIMAASARAAPVRRTMNAVLVDEQTILRATPDIQCSICLQPQYDPVTQYTILHSHANVIHVCHVCVGANIV